MQLTDEQIEAAAKEAYGKLGPDRRGLVKWESLDFQQQARYWAAMRVAAPFLQMPWKMPNTEEIWLAQGGGVRGAKELICSFVDRRNSFLIPKPVDPRREKVIAEVEAIKQHHSQQRLGEPGLSPAQVADRILAALDAKDEESEHNFRAMPNGRFECCRCGVLSGTPYSKCKGA